MYAPQGAAADDGPIHVKGDNDGVVTTDVQAAGSQSGVVHSDSASSSGCTWGLLLVVDGVGRPPVPAGGYGSWWQPYCRDGLGEPVWIPNGSPQLPSQGPSAATLAARAVNQMQLPAPGVHVNPEGRALVGLAEWFWVDGSAWRTLIQRTQAGPVWARVVATPVSTTWDPGDGAQSFSCAGPGTAYDKSEPAGTQHTDCSYTYRRSSADQSQTGPDPNDRFFTVTVTTTWSVTWTGAGGTGGALPAMTRSSSFPLAVAERDAVVTGASG